MSDTPDHDLLAAWRDGRDEQAFAELVTRHGPLVHGACRRVCRAAADADDATQETFAALARDARRVTGALPAWLHTVATRRAWRAVRRRRWRQWRAAPTEVGGEAEITDLDHAVASLPPDERDVVVLTYFAGETQERVAERIGVHQSTVHRRLEDGLARLRRRLATALTVVVAAKPALAANVVERWTRGALAAGGGGVAGRVFAATAVIVGSVATAGVSDAWWPVDPPPAMDLRGWFRWIESALAVFVALAVVAGIVEFLAWRRTRRGGPWIGIALTAAMLLKFQVMLAAGNCRYWPDHLMVGGWLWTTAVAVAVVALAVFALDIARSAAMAGRLPTVLRAIVAGLAVVMLIDSAASIRLFRGRPDRAESERSEAGRRHAQDEEMRLQYDRQGMVYETWTDADGLRRTRITPKADAAADGAGGPAAASTGVR